MSESTVTFAVFAKRLLDYGVADNIWKYWTTGVGRLGIIVVWAKK